MIKMYILLLITCTVSLSAMKQESKVWDLQRYFDTKELIRWGTTTQESAQQYCIDGKKIWQNLFDNQCTVDGSHQTLHQFDQKKELIKRVAVCWYVYSQALEQKKPFYNGMFIIKDTDDHAVYNFFYKYVEGTIDKAHKSPVYYSTNLFSYARHSTHFKRDKIKESEYGIAIRYSQEEWPSYDLPSGCSHILFGKLNKNNDNRSRMYLKMEDAGLYVTELPYHTMGVFSSYARKLLPYVLGMHMASKIITLNDGTFCQKEHVPCDILDRYYKICKEHNLALQPVYSISQLWEHVSNHEERDSLYPLKEYLQNNYSDLQERFGNEIIIDTRVSKN